MRNESVYIVYHRSGLESDIIYPNGISCTLPEDLQQTIINTIAGLEHAKMLYPGVLASMDCFNTDKLTEGEASVKVFYV